jgi:hypothetical protein
MACLSAAPRHAPATSRAGRDALTYIRRCGVAGTPPVAAGRQAIRGRWDRSPARSTFEEVHARHGIP